MLDSCSFTKFAHTVSFTSFRCPFLDFDCIFPGDQCFRLLIAPSSFFCKVLRDDFNGDCRRLHAFLSRNDCLRMELCSLRHARQRMGLLQGAQKEKRKSQLQVQAERSEFPQASNALHCLLSLPQKFQEQLRLAGNLMTN